jgi:hypothetical protein
MMLRVVNQKNGKPGGSALTAKIPKGKAKVSYVLPEKLVERIKIRAVRQKKRLSGMVEELLVDGLRYDPEASRSPEATTATAS